MKLSFKFFCIAYIIVLLSTGLGGAYIIKTINDTLWNTQIERVHSAANYAADSFMAFADVSSDKIGGSRKNDILRQIKNTCDSTVSAIELYPSDTAAPEYTALDDNESISQFVRRDDRLLMKSTCKLNTGADVYYLAVYSDFTEIQTQCRLFWNSYGMVVLGISAISGLLLLALTKTITTPLGRLAKAADEIASGNYGKTVAVRRADREIAVLSESFNSMSVAVEQTIHDIREESEKRNRFVADFTHELKTPMTAIIGYSQLLHSYELNDTEKGEATEAIYNEAKRLEALSLQLLDLYVFQNEEIELEDVDLAAIEDQLKTTLKYVAEKYDVALCVNLGAGTVLANRVLLLSLLYNLADNAFKASKPQSVVTLYSRSFGDSVQIVVEDHGKGIAKENIAFLTEPFYREDKSRSRALGGAGLGLALCKEIAALHGTALCFESEQGKGTTVSFALQKGGNENERA